MMDDKTVRRGRGTAAGFTLVEMVIVIGIIILLAALTLSVSVAVVEGSEVRQTENTIRLLTAALQEWEAQADRKISYGIDDDPYGGERYEIWQPANGGDLVQFLQESHVATRWVFAIISRPTSVKQILAQVDPESVEQDTVQDNSGNAVDTFVFRDAWDNPIVAVFPGRSWADGTDDPDYRDSDGTIRTDIERMCGVTANRQICFVSAGPDGEFGDLDSPDDTVIEQAQDNLYSYDPPETSSQ